MSRTTLELDESESDSLKEEAKRDKLPKIQCNDCDGEGVVLTDKEFFFADLCETCNGTREIPDDERMR